MASSLPANRLPALAVVAVAHALAVAFLLELTRTPPRNGAAAETLTRVEFLTASPALLPEPPVAIPPDRSRPSRAVAPPGESRPPPASEASPGTGSTTIDWAAEATVAASRWIAKQEQSRGRRAFGTPPAGAMFAPAPRRKPGLAWNYARTHRVEALPGGVTVFNLNDHCSIALLWVVPFLGCTLGKIPVRGDLFEHLHDWRNRDD